MAEPRVRYDDHSAEVLLELATEWAPLVEDMAEILREEIVAQIDVGAAPSPPGQPPASPTGSYASSWHVSKVTRHKDSITASAFSKAQTSAGESLADALEFGTEKMAPRPHVRPGILRADARIAALVRKESSR